MTSVPTIEQIRYALTLDRPGLSGWSRMMPQPRGIMPPPGQQPRQAGVLLLLYPLDGRLHVVLTKRTEDLKTHKGQISLPGGGVEAGEVPAAAALREAHEELGVVSESVAVLGKLTPLYLPPSNYFVHPVVAYAALRPAFLPDPREVAEVLEVPLAALLDADTVAEETWDLRGVDTRVPYYRVGPHKVWGATAMVLAEMAAVVSAIQLSAPLQQEGP